MAIRNISDNDQPTYDLREIKRKLQKDGDAPDVVHIRTTTEEIEISTDDVEIRDYQRKFSPSWARSIAKNFDVDLFDKPLVAPLANGKYAVIDGQHRIAALRIRFSGKPVTFVADVDPDATAEARQAKRFSGRNHYVRKTGTGDHLRALIVEGDRDAIAFRDILDEAGYTIKWGGGKTRPGTIPPAVWKSVIAKCPSTWRRDLADALDVCNRAYGTTDFPLDTDFVVGLALFLRTYRDDPMLDRERFIGKLSEHVPRSLFTKAQTLKALGEAGSNVYGMRKVLVSTYNHGAHHRKLEA